MRADPNRKMIRAGRCEERENKGNQGPEKAQGADTADLLCPPPAFLAHVFTKANKRLIGLPD